MIGGIEETSASFEARSAPRSYPTGVQNRPRRPGGMGNGAWPLAPSYRAHPRLYQKQAPRYEGKYKHSRTDATGISAFDRDVAPAYLADINIASSNITSPSTIVEQACRRRNLRRRHCQYILREHGKVGGKAGSQPALCLSLPSAYAPPDV